MEPDVSTINRMLGLMSPAFTSAKKISVSSAHSGDATSEAIRKVATRDLRVRMLPIPRHLAVTLV
jgi:hypothetical protein